jgi:hypothetical protein
MMRARGETYSRGSGRFEKVVGTARSACNRKEDKQPEVQGRNGSESCTRRYCGGCVGGREEKRRAKA